MSSAKMRQKNLDLGDDFSSNSGNFTVIFFPYNMAITTPNTYDTEDSCRIPKDGGI